MPSQSLTLTRGKQTRITCHLRVLGKASRKIPLTTLIEAHTGMATAHHTPPTNDADLALKLERA